jgi:L-lactate dehydrogenase complex protein LldE
VRIALFLTCFNDTLFPRTGQAVVALLERLGHIVDFPLDQTCCGQMHVNSGYARDALPLLGRFVDIFQGADVVVTPSASCAAMVRDGYPRLAARHGDAALVTAVAALSARVLELSELLVRRLGVEDVGAYFPHRVTYHPTCHSLRALRVDDAPLRLLRRVRGVELVELPAAEECCGFGGTFSVKNADVSAAMLEDKVRCVLATGAGTCVAADNSCLMHIGGGLRRCGAGVRTLHLAEVLASTERSGVA